jgi:hypothetical protein
MSLVVDRKGVVIQAGQRVRVFQVHEITEGIVIDPFPDNPTKDKEGHWVDIDRGHGYEGMMSYLLEVIPDLDVCVIDKFSSRVCSIGVKSCISNHYQQLVLVWKSQADKSTDEREQSWLYACAADLQSLIDIDHPKENE